MRKHEKGEKRKEKDEQEKKQGIEDVPWGWRNIVVQNMGGKMSEASLHCVHAHYRHSSVIQLS